MLVLSRITKLITKVSSTKLIMKVRVFTSQSIKRVLKSKTKK